MTNNDQINVGPDLSAQNPITAFAIAQLGKPYVQGSASAGPNAWDCSGLVMMAWRQAGLNVAHQSAIMYGQTKHVPIADAQAGDMLFLSSNRSPTGDIHHVMLCMGDGTLIEAADYGIPVRRRAYSATEDEMMPVAGAVPASVRATLGSGPAINSGTVGVAQDAVSIPGVSDLSAAWDAASTIFSTALSVSFWKRAGMFAAGAAIIGGAVYYINKG